MRQLFVLGVAVWVVMAAASPVRAEPASDPDLMAAMDAVARGDCPAEIKLLTAMAKRGAEGEGLLGIMYYQGRCGPRDFSKAGPLLRAAADQGDAAAQATLGEMYYDGQGVPQDYTEAAKWFRMAGDEGETNAQVMLGLMYLQGAGVPQNYVEAAKWIRAAADQGSADAQYLLGTMYAYGKGVPLDDAQAVVWFSKSAEQEYADAEAELGKNYYNGKGVPQDYATAREWLRKASDQGSAGAESLLGVMYDEGNGVPQDHGVAVNWYRKAADQGDANAQAMLGTKYVQGQGVPRNYVEAAMWLRRGADQGERHAQFFLGSLYADGTGVAQDYVQAHKWLNLAAAQFTASEAKMRAGAVKLRDQLATKMTPAQVAEAQRLAREWTPKAATVISSASEQAGSQVSSTPVHHEHLEFRGSPQNVALWDAAASVDLDGVTTALKAGADPNATTKTANPLTPLQLVAMSQVGENASTMMVATKAAKMLFHAGAKLGPADSDILYFPIASGNLPLVQLLVENGASPVRELDGFTPTELARKYDQAAVYDYLVSQGAVPVDDVRTAQITLVEVAGHDAFLESLHGGDGSLAIAKMQLAVSQGASVNDAGPDNETPLIAALRFGISTRAQVDSIRWLLDHGADPNRMAESGFTGVEGLPLHVFVAMNAWNSTDGTPPPSGAQSMAGEVLALLLHSGAKVSGMDSKGRTPLHVAAQSDNVWAAQALILAGARVMARDASGRVPLDYAESAEMIRLLKANGAAER